MTTPEPEQPEVCEGCGAIATTYDTEGVPLCEECAALPVEGAVAAADDLESASHERGTRSVQRVDVLAARWREQARDAIYAAGRAKAHGMEGLQRSMAARATALTQCADEIEEWAGSGHIE